MNSSNAVRMADPKLSIKRLGFTSVLPAMMVSCEGIVGQEVLKYPNPRSFVDQLA